MMDISTIEWFKTTSIGITFILIFILLTLQEILSELKKKNKNDQNRR